MRILFPITPHICAELWQVAKLGDDIEKSSWPKIDEAALNSLTQQFIVQINGKMRGSIIAVKDLMANPRPLLHLADDSRRPELLC